MLKGVLIHPQIVGCLGRAGHGSQILIADGNFPFLTHTNSAAEKVYLNLSPGVVGCTDVLKALCSAVPIESAMVMAPNQTGEYAVSTPDIWSDFSQILDQNRPGLSLDQTGRFSFYEACKSSRVAMVIATGEQRIFANLLLTIGVVQ